jgi:thiamine pyrophosphate-dependent acetolactate synthase large subunit-like protein
MEAIGALMERVSDDTLIVCCNGMIGRELFTAKNRPSNFYMIGSMGLGLSIGLGLALAQPSKKVVVLDGDGNVLMGMNVLASVGSEQPKNLWHVVLDNETHASTGGQRTISGQIKLEEVARATGYRSAERAADVSAFGAALDRAFAEAGPRMVLGVVEGGTLKGIARVEPSPPELAARFAKEAQR